MQFLHKIIGPLVRILRLVDSDERPSMPFDYDEMQNTIEEIKIIRGMKEETYKLFLDNIARRRENQFCHPLHVVAHMFNSQTRYHFESIIICSYLTYKYL